jgi:hypothetical protein
MGFTGKGGRDMARAVLKTRSGCSTPRFNPFQGAKSLNNNHPSGLASVGLEVIHMLQSIWRFNDLGVSALKVGFVLLGLGCGPGLSSLAQAQTIQPLTNVDVANHTGYFSDPYLVPLSGTGSTYITGTTQKYLICHGPLQPGCGQSQSITVDTSSLEAKAQRAGATITSIAGLHPLQNSQGLWMMVLTLHVQKEGSVDPDEGATAGWSVIVHAAASVPHSASLPVNWTADDVLVGSFSKDVKANYNGKYFEHDGQLYLTYIKRLGDKPPRDGIVAQKMRTPSEKADEEPVLLLQPSDDSDSKASEIYYPDGGGDLKLVETCNITEINGKFALAYAVGAFNRRNYKSAVAWSDTFLPPPEKTYRKVTRPDPNGIWSNNKHDEVVYLLQAEKPNWPNYVKSQVIAPGVPTISRSGPNGGWVLIFAGYAPGDNPTNSNGTFEGNHRRPFYVRLNVSVPGDKSVSAVSQDELATWITLAH